ncbi:conserved oligomeric Golgi complex subunit 1 isoform X2 [Tribolium castaneum]|uniref:conserved oligomeric Golgi complex subunit 1 isoform X2 n=1 Tax=Tribolium castaneum TaxID=7070 RepID=UPI00077DD0E3|nr:PREDICTED: conserved oligomeric Golgi complex subunit 1 isoform X2 [Tribolium castaneum]|eukprot:XP_015836994.1 PREDICTED: conserved oligomeric Golgi complex subunit 1 isoform X2 [Tribolium castaneum]
MARISYNLLELDVDKLFEEHKIEEIVEIEKLLDAEIERKRVELRSMVGDRYKDVLAASDAIKNMKTISQQIVDNIQNITDICEDLIESKDDKAAKTLPEIDTKCNEERVLIVQVRLAIFMNEQIWTALDGGDNLTAAQFYLLAQHIHMGLSLTKKEYLDKLPLLKQIRANLATLRDQIFERIKQKLEFVEITAEETSSNLNALLLLRNQSATDLLNIFIEHRKIALNTVINTSHASVRLQISAMVRCLITTIHLLHDCFMCYGNSKKGLIWQQLENIVEDESIPTLSKVDLPVTPLIAYIPDVIKQFRPKYKSFVGESAPENVKLGEWLASTKESVCKGLESSLKLITSVKGLHIIREEALKIELPSDWERICSESNLPENFNVWYYFFQSLITKRASELISKKVSCIIKDLESEIREVLSGNLGSEHGETDLRWYTWVEDPTDVSRIENKHTGLSMKTLGYSQNVVNLCEKLDGKYLELLIDVSQYLYGKEFTDDVIIYPHLKSDRKKFVDREELENHLRLESTKNSTSLTLFLHDFIKSESHKVAKSLLCARFLQAVTNLCPHFNKCCTFNASTEDWSRICGHFTKSSVQFWENWIESCVQETDKQARKLFSDVSVCSMISVLLRWDSIEIQEQTDEKIFKSQIKVPLKPSLTLHRLLSKLNDDLSHVLPHTLPKQVHLQFIEKTTETILNHYKLALDHNQLNQNQSLQLLFDVKFVTTFSIQRENSKLVALSQEICDKLRARIDPFDLDVFYSHLQNNVKRAVLQSQAILGCLLPSSAQLANLGVGEKFKEEKEPSVMALSVPSVSFPLFCTFAHQIPAQKAPVVDVQEVKICGEGFTI